MSKSRFCRKNWDGTWIDEKENAAAMASEQRRINPSIGEYRVKEKDTEKPLHPIDVYGEKEWYWLRDRGFLWHSEHEKAYKNFGSSNVKEAEQALKEKP